MALQQWAVPRLGELLPLEEAELHQILAYTETLSDAETARHLGDLLGDTSQANQFITSYNERRAELATGTSQPVSNGAQAPPVGDVKPVPNLDSKPSPVTPSNYGSGDVKQTGSANGNSGPPPQYAPPSGPPPASGMGRAYARVHKNEVTEAARNRARDEQEMQQLLMDIQYRYGIYNSDIEPEHETEYPCGCDVCRYKQRKWNRLTIQEMWCRAVMYPGEKYYHDSTYPGSTRLFNNNPYRFRVVSPYGYGINSPFSMGRPIPSYYTRSIHQTIDINNQLNREAEQNVRSREPKHSIWSDDALENAMSKLAVGDGKRSSEKQPVEKPSAGASTADVASEKPSKSRLSAFRKSLGIKSSEERAVAKVQKDVGKGQNLRDQIVREEQGRWPDDEWRFLVATYQDKVGMTGKIADLRQRHPIEYLHLLKAGYFEPIPVAWADQASNPLKFSIEASAGWRGITPAWRGYEDTAEERLYWVLNHREGSVGMRMKPDFISEMNMARARMATAVEPPPLYNSPTDTCRVQHTSSGYSKQVMPSPFRAYDRPESPTDDTMILLDVSGSMNFDPVRPIYNEYLITGYTRSTQPKNKDVAKAIIRRFTDAMENHDHQFRGYDLTTFANHAKYIGTVNHSNLDEMWRNVRIGGGTRVMTGWQKVKELHFQKHSQSATHHPVYGWQAGPQTPMLRLLLLLDGEATDMDEFELDLLGLSWAHVTIFLIGVDGCPHHHRHANELQRISDVNHHVSFVDAQGNFPERFVTHELLKRHLGYEVTMQEFEQMEELPPYSE